MKYPAFHTPSALLKAALIALVLSLISLPFLFSANSQTRPRTASSQPSSARPSGTPEDTVKVDVDLVTVDALVLQKKTARVVGDLQKADFAVAEDGVKQTITHFSQDSLPISMLLLVDRGGCLDPFGTEVRAAARHAIAELKPTDELALMTYHDEVELLQPFTRDRQLIYQGLESVPPHDEEAHHCLNTAFGEAAAYIQNAGNPIGRRVIVVITGVTRDFDCLSGPSSKSASQAVYESGAVVSAIVPKSSAQRMENAVMRWATRLGKLGGAPYIDVQTLANETGGEILEDKPENLSSTFATLINHLRTRYNLAFVSTNKKRDGTTRKLKIDVASGAQKARGKLVVKARRSYVAPRT
jgi:VWFA-related protein